MEVPCGTRRERGPVLVDDVQLAGLIEQLRALGLRPLEPLLAETCSVAITRVVFDSRAAGPGALFVARYGHRVDGHSFIHDAADAGVSAIVGSEPADALRERGTPYVRVDDPPTALGWLAALVEGRPSSSLKVVGVTGTDGKTTVATLLHQLFTALGHTSGLIGTTGIRVGRDAIATAYTTPDAVELQRVLAAMVRRGCTHCFMEVTSHAVDQRRIAGIDFDGGIFTNLSPEHLDYHDTIEAYAAVKRRFLSELPASAFAVVNADDPRARFMVERTRARVIHYGAGREAPLPWTVERCDEGGMLLRIGPHRTHTTLLGAHNASNLAAAATAAFLLGEDLDRIVEAIPHLRGARGRMERVATQPVLGIVDYAHTPYALRAALGAARRHRPTGKLLVVGGCGGDRDSRKRPAMGDLIATADVPIFTSDNARSEDAAAIVEAMVNGVPLRRRDAVRVELDRSLAIRLAASAAGPGDVIVVTGKGHETTQEIGGEKRQFDDRVELRRALDERWW